MTAKSINFYGYDRDTYCDCLALIRSTNRRNITMMNAWFLAVNLLYVLFSASNLFGVTQERLPFYATYAVCAFLFALLLVLLPRFTERHSFLMVYVCMAIMISYGILVSVGQPYMPATMYLILLALTSITFIDNLARMIAATLVASAVFLLSSYRYKTFSIAYYDTYNVVITLLLALGLHYTLQRGRLSQFVLYQRNLQIQRELEVTSSFDSLTGLLNRGRFFSVAEAALRHADGRYTALCLLDLDGFKQINDRMGHQMGDKVIQTAGRVLMDAIGFGGAGSGAVSEWDLTADFSMAGRLGGDEFILLLRGKQDRSEVRRLLQDTLGALNAVRFGGLEGIHASFGVTELSAGERDLDGAYSRADAALYESKRAGKNRIHFSGEEQGDA